MMQEKKELTFQQWQFCEIYLSKDNKKNLYEIYEEVYKPRNRNSAYVAASRLMAEPKIQRYLEAKKKLLAFHSRIDKEEILEMLWEDAKENREKRNSTDMIKALQEINKMQGFYASIKVDQTNTVNVTVENKENISKAIQAYYQAQINNGREISKIEAIEEFKQIFGFQETQPKALQSDEDE